MCVHWLSSEWFRVLSDNDWCLEVKPDRKPEHEYTLLRLFVICYYHPVPIINRYTHATDHSSKVTD
jgi:hypothetical protein